MTKRKVVGLKSLVKKLSSLLESKKAQNVKIIDVSKVTTEFSYMVIADSDNKYQMESIAYDLLDFANEYKLSVFGSDLNFESGWIVIDFYDIIVHIMTPVLREYYQLERIWEVPKMAEVV
jgi:ribosome-associated protein